MTRPRLLDLFCGAGGAAVGYSRAGFEVVGVDIKPQPHYPFKFAQLDALMTLDALLAGGFMHVGPQNGGGNGPTGGYFFLDDFAAIHASPPCQAYIQRNKNLVTKWPRLIEPMRCRLEAAYLPFVIENVPAAPLRAAISLCGTGFGLPLLRHRIFETSFRLTEWAPPCNHWGTVASGDFAGVYAFGGKGHRHGRDDEGNKVRDPGSAPGPAWEVAMGIDWMTRDELSQAIPPAYTEFIGKQLMAAL